MEITAVGGGGGGGRGGPAGAGRDDAGVSGVHDDSAEISISPRVPRALKESLRSVPDIEPGDDSHLPPAGSSVLLPLEEDILQKGHNAVRQVAPGDESQEIQSLRDQGTGMRPAYADAADLSETPGRIRAAGNMAQARGDDVIEGYDVMVSADAAPSDYHLQHAQTGPVVMQPRASVVSSGDVRPESLRAGIEELAADAANRSPGIDDRRRPAGAEIAVSDRQLQDRASTMEGKESPEDVEDKEAKLRLHSGLKLNDLENHQTSDIEIGVASTSNQQDINNSGKIRIGADHAELARADPAIIHFAFSPSSNQDNILDLQIAAGKAAATHGKASAVRRGLKGTVFIWDVDETLIIYQSLKNRRFSRQYWKEKGDEMADKLGDKWNSAIVKLTDLLESKLKASTRQVQRIATNLAELYADVEENQYRTTLGVTYPSGPTREKQLADKFPDIQKLYDEGVGSLVSQEQEEEWQKLYEETDAFTEGWLSAGRELLEACQVAAQDSTARKAGLQDYVGRRIPSSHQISRLGSAPGQVQKRPKLERRRALAEAGDGEKIAETGENVNVVVSSAALVATLAKLMLFRLNDLIHPLNVYSSRSIGKLEVFKRIHSRFSAPKHKPPVYFCVVGNGVDELAAARAMGWPAVEVQLSEVDLRLPNLSFSDVAERVEAAKKDFQQG